MSCCGSQRSALRHDATGGEAAATAAHYRTPDVAFEYAGPGQLVVTGPMTGVVYRFGGNGARLRVHGSDAPSLASVPGLRAVR